MRIRRTLATDENDAVIMGGTTKTEAGRRILSIPEHIYPHIIEQMKYASLQENNEEKLLFKPENAKYTRRTNVNSELHRILEKYFGIKDISTQEGLLKVNEYYAKEKLIGNNEEILKEDTENEEKNER